MTSYLPGSDPRPVDPVVTENDMTPGNELRCDGQMRREFMPRIGQVHGIWSGLAEEKRHRAAKTRPSHGRKEDDRTNQRFLAR
jgi:hypothetical protein